MTAGAGASCVVGLGVALTMYTHRLHDPQCGTVPGHWTARTRSWCSCVGHRAYRLRHPQHRHMLALLSQWFIRLPVPWQPKLPLGWLFQAGIRGGMGCWQLCIEVHVGYIVLDHSKCLGPANRYDIQGWCCTPGAIATWNLARAGSSDSSGRPDRLIDVDTCVMCCAFHPTEPVSLVAPHD